MTNGNVYQAMELQETLTEEWQEYWNAWIVEVNKVRNKE